MNRVWAIILPAFYLWRVYIFEYMHVYDQYQYLWLIFQTDFGKWLFGTLFLGSSCQSHPDSLLNQSFKHNLVHMSPLNSNFCLLINTFWQSFMMNVIRSKSMLIRLAISIYLFYSKPVNQWISQYTILREFNLFIFTLVLQTLGRMEKAFFIVI